MKLHPLPFVLSLALACVFAIAPPAHGEETPAAFHSKDVSGYPIDTSFTLKDPDGRDRQLADFKGRVILLFFGFTQCPNVCPTALLRATEIKRLLGDDGAKLQVLFVTVDPERDTPEVLRGYTTAFDPSFLGLYTDAEKLNALSKNLKFTYSKIPTGSSYTMDHSAISYVFDPAGKIRLLFSHSATASDCAEDIRLLLKQP